MNLFKKYDYLILPSLIVGLLLNPFSIEALTTKYKAIKIEATTSMILNGVEIANWGEAAGFKIKVTSNDTTEDFLKAKLVGSANITITETNDGSNETYVTSVTSGSIGTIELTDDEVTLGKLAGGTANRAFVTDGSGDPALELLDYDVMQTQTQGDVLIYESSGVPNNLAAGTDGQFLETNGSGANATFSWVPTQCEYFSSSGTWIHTANISNVRVIAIGGGGGGGAGGSDGGNGGGGGEYISMVVAVSTNITVTLGAAGVGAPSSDGTNGGDTTFGSLVTANGGDGGGAGSGVGTDVPGAGGTGGGVGGGVIFAGNDGTSAASSGSADGTDGGTHGFIFGTLIGGVGRTGSNGVGGAGTKSGDGGGGGRGTNEAGGNGVGGIMVVCDA